MKIIKRGEVPSLTKRFTCNHCHTIFEAGKNEYHSTSQIAQIYDGILYEAECPVCGKSAYLGR